MLPYFDLARLFVWARLRSGSSQSFASPKLGRAQQSSPTMTTNHKSQEDMAVLGQRLHIR